MRRIAAICAVGLAGCLLAGCGGGKQPSSRPSAGRQAGATVDERACDQAAGLLRQGRLTEADEALARLEARLDSLPDALRLRVQGLRAAMEEAEKATAGGRMSSETMPDANAARAATDKVIAAARAEAARAAAEVTRAAESLLATITRLTAEGKVADAEEMLSTLEENVKALPAELRSRVTAARAALNALRGATTAPAKLPAPATAPAAP